LRDPVERLISQYYHVLRSPEHYLHHQVKEGNLGLGDFARAQLAPELDNGQIRYLAGIRDLPCGQITRDHLEQAIENLHAHFAVAGLVERFDESVLLMKQVLDWTPPIYTRTNVGSNRPPRAELDQADLAAVRETCELDCELYNYVEELLDRRIGAAGGQFAEEVGSFQALNGLPRTVEFLQQHSLDLANRLNLRGEELQAQGRDAQALQAFMKATDIWPHHVPALINLTLHYLRLGNLPMAQPPLASALRLDPGNMQARRLQAEIQETLAATGGGRPATIGTGTGGPAPAGSAGTARTEPVRPPLPPTKDSP
jgi:tetratricopeptide (TPR) repeat protein